MPTNAELERVLLLRKQGNTSKQIARALGIRPAEATELVRAAAALAQADADATEPELVGCWINTSWSAGLTIAGHPEWLRDTDSDPGVEGLATVLVARRHRYDKVAVCGYLADVYCLGVKNAFGPKTMNERELLEFRRKYFSRYDNNAVEAPIELVREVVLGSVEYARGLGFEPHPDFAKARPHLGPWTGPSSITFGKNEKPLYISGPYDEPYSVVRTLQESAGDGNFDYIAAIA